MQPRPSTLSAGHRQILSAISREGSRSRTELATLLGLSKATISGLVRDLLAQNILCEQELIFGVGRPSVSLAVRADAASFIGISLQQDPAVLLLTDLHGTVHARVEIPRLSDPEQAIRSLADGILQLREEAGDAAERLSGIGIALPGFVSHDRHTCVTCTALGWRNVNIGTALAERTGLPTWVENDANALILGEQLFGTLRGSPDFSMVFVSHGIGCAHIVNGRLLRGHFGGAGELSHAPVALEGFGALPCRCGNKGCLETVASLLAISNAAHRAGQPTDISTLTALAAKGQPEPLAILHQAGSAMGLATAQLIQMLDPSHVVVMLDSVLHDSVFGHALLKEAETHILHRAGVRTMIHFRDFAAESFAGGAASLAAHYFIFGPEAG
ncbi:ROK family transcriptional regulator [Acetobacter oeni]|uniref:Transcriptional regulator n=1 Tax=Acetobacter oeni TaxID=304077 RepID=A0A511XLQ9_9PROT|nr:ROK family transcriptional regulator [Acetobacter oeni]MBB3881840.1 putative NBD/HSP70 family sugar kinase [Acetobacter oeni]NHO17833.1 ROK family protein [Acetobacter oeni]GBR05366.1 ROK family protein [Acetobacter oeni LMG 21952]GEN63883.1 transcriptional regulator [Acetobacter oeni]